MFKRTSSVCIFTLLVFGVNTLSASIPSVASAEP
jgi:hypothetical protein